RRAIKATAHHLKPVVRIGQRGVSEAVIQETGRALDDHETIKVHIAEDDRLTRRDMAEALARACQAALIGTIGKTAILHRPKQELEDAG
ncbi:MAG: ribosome assembly RNA-binding protein YhbY, partial [Mariprofundaceae bacterium]